MRMRMKTQVRTEIQMKIEMYENSLIFRSMQLQELW